MTPSENHQRRPIEAVNAVRTCAALFPSILLLAACGLQLELAENTKPQTDDFGQHLYDGYLGLSRAERADGRLLTSDHFAERAILAARGARPDPVQVEADTAETEGAQASREWLLDLLAEGGIERFPAEAARAQVMFDCWAQGLALDPKTEKAAACRDGFLAETENLHRKLREGRAADFVVYFGHDDAALSQDAIATLMDVVFAAKRKGLAILARGHTDQTGPAIYNDWLSQQRVDTVTKFLLESGIQKDWIEIQIHGEAQPLQAGAETRSVAKNRRVEIEFLPPLETAGTRPLASQSLGASD